MPTGDLRPDEKSIGVPLVQRLVSAQFPQWAELPIRPVRFDGWDNRTFRLGEDMSVRLPSAEGYVAQVEKEHRWLPRLAPRLPLRIPVPLAQGAPGEGYPWPWSIYRWLEGESAAVAPISDLPRFASALAHFLTALQQIDPAEGSAPGPHNFYRGAPVAVYDAETRRALSVLNGEVDTHAATAVWEVALRSTCQSTPVWFHGDVASGNLLVRGGRLCAVIDFGCSGVGDPACNLTIAWTLLSGESRTAFRAGLTLDDATWARARGWALWKGLITLAEHVNTNPTQAERARYVIDQVLAEHKDSA